MLKKLISYFLPINIFKTDSKVSKAIEVTMHNGELVMDAKSVNYSYGSLQRALRVGLKQIGFEHIREMENILVLGVAGGSVIKTLVDEIAFEGKIKGVEIDSEIIGIANTYFKLDQIPNLEIVIADAEEFVKIASEKYDLIVVDVFEDNIMPAFLFEKTFTDNLLKLLQPKGVILFNTLSNSSEDSYRNQNFIHHFNSPLLKITTLSGIEGHNELMIISKNS